MSLRVEYFRDRERVMIVAFLKHEWEAKQEALEGLVHYGADMALIRDMDHGGKTIGVVKRNA